MKKSPIKKAKVDCHNILTMFKKQLHDTKKCSDCGLNILQSKLNYHLSRECINSVKCSMEQNNDKCIKSNTIATKSEGISVETEIITLSDDSSSAIDEGVGKPVNTKIKSKISLKRKRKGNEQRNQLNIKPTINTNVQENSNLTPNVKPCSVINKPLPSLSMHLYNNNHKVLKSESISEDDLKITSVKSTVEVSSTSVTVEEQYKDLNDLDLKGFDDVVFSDDNVDSQEENKEHKNKYLPYYIANFKFIIEKVLNDDYNKHLFNDEDLKCIDVFQSLTDCAQRLYVRIFQRKYKWLRPNNMNYSEISDDLLPYLEELVHAHLLDTGAEQIELEPALNLLSLPEVKNLSKHFNLNASGKNKTEIAEILIKHGKQHKSFFFTSGTGSVTSAILKKVRQVLGPCYKLTLEPKRLFTRILMLFSLPTMSEDDEEAAGGQQQQLLTVLQVNKGDLVFPTYTILREFQIFEDRESLLRYEAARQMENDIISAIESKKFEAAKQLYLDAKNQFETLLKEGISERDKEMPFFLRRYSACHVYVRCMNQGVEILQRLRQYNDAIEQLRYLLEQNIYCRDRRGQWWERLALNLDQHLKQRDKAANCIREALEDSYVRVGPRHSLMVRAERLKKSNKDNEQLSECVEEMSGLITAPKVTIKGKLLPHPIPGRKHVFISSAISKSSLENDVTVLGVEQLALEHYKGEGYIEGIHGEGSTFISLYTLLFWDIIYDGNIPDSFISPYQTHPLDLNSDDFFRRREAQITSHLEYLRNAPSEDLCEIVQTTWNSHKGQASLVSWDNFTDVDHVMGLVRCFGNVILAGICERIAKDFRFTRSGVPDLVVWNPDTKIVKVVEVKGPGDKLSSKQILWLDYLIKIGADAEVCLVEAVGSKKLKRQ